MEDCPSPFRPQTRRLRFERVMSLVFLSRQSNGCSAGGKDISSFPNGSIVREDEHNSTFGRHWPCPWEEED